jgi:hypothetical protein
MKASKPYSRQSLDVMIKVEACEHVGCTDVTLTVITFYMSNSFRSTVCFDKLSNFHFEIF